MESFKDKASSMTNMSNLQSMVGDIRFPASKDEVLRQLQQKGAPSQVTDKLRSLNIKEFNSFDDFKQQIGNLGM